MWKKFRPINACFAIFKFGHRIRMSNYSASDKTSSCDAPHGGFNPVKAALEEAEWREKRPGHSKALPRAKSRARKWDASSSIICVWKELVLRDDALGEGRRENSSYVQQV